MDSSHLLVDNNVLLFGQWFRKVKETEQDLPKASVLQTL
jgi:hypothetical protein